MVYSCVAASYCGVCLDLWREGKTLIRSCFLLKWLPVYGVHGVWWLLFSHNVSAAITSLTSMLYKWTVALMKHDVLLRSMALFTSMRFTLLSIKCLNLVLCWLFAVIGFCGHILFKLLIELFSNVLRNFTFIAFSACLAMLTFVALSCN